MRSPAEGSIASPSHLAAHVAPCDCPKMPAMIQSHIEGLDLLKRGKVRDVYDLGSELLIVATDRISCFDVVLPTPIPEKGRILTHLSRFWFCRTRQIIRNPLLIASLPDLVSDEDVRHQIEGRWMLVRKAVTLPIEAVVQGYLSGSSWKEYRERGSVCGIALPPGLRECEKLPEPIFVLATKAIEGLDKENITFSRAAEIVGPEFAEGIRSASLRLYALAAEIAIDQGIIIAESEFEFGLLDGGLVLIDEGLSPDSSRFWPTETYRPGGPQPSLDKQCVRDHLIGTGWDMALPAPELPNDLVQNTGRKYRDALRRLTRRVDRS